MSTAFSGTRCKIQQFVLCELELVGNLLAELKKQVRLTLKKTDYLKGTLFLIIFLSKVPDQICLVSAGVWQTEKVFENKNFP